MTHATCRLTAKNRYQLRNPTIGNRVCSWPLCSNIKSSIKSEKPYTTYRRRAARREIEPRLQATCTQTFNVCLQCERRTRQANKQTHRHAHGLHWLPSLFLVYTSVTPIATAVVLLYRFYCIFVYHVLIIFQFIFCFLGSCKSLIALFVQLVYCHV